MDIIKEILEAENRIRPHILKTPLIESRELSKLINGKVYLKLESEQYTGSFKARGSLNKILSLTNDERAQGVITASTGNHAQGFARALEITQSPGTVYLPENASKAKISALQNYPVQLEFYSTDSLSTEMYAKEQALKHGKIWVSPYNDQQVIGGQGTIGIEIIDQLEEVDSVLITIGGGGLISGIGIYLKSINKSIQVVGCQPENSPEMTLSLKAGKITNLDAYIPTLSDGSAGGIEDGSVTFPICQEVVDDTILVSEEEIAEAIRYAARMHHKIIEGAAGVAIASLVKFPEKFKGQKVVIIVCGANIDINKFKELL